MQEIKISEEDVTNDAPTVQQLEMLLGATLIKEAVTKLYEIIAQSSD